MSVSVTGASVMSSNGEDDIDYDETTATVVKTKTEVVRPPMYKVVLLNDDYTPMDFVVDVLMLFFGMTQAQATDVMLTVHQQGKGVCGIFSRDVAETKASVVNQFSRENKHPLLCEVEKV